MRISDWISDVCSSDLLTLLVQHAGNVGEKEKTRRAQRRRNCARHGVGIDVVSMPVIADADGRDDRDHARSADRIKQATVDMAWLPHETQVHDTLDIAIRISLRAPDCSEERRAGKACVSTCRSRCLPHHKNKTTQAEHTEG